MRDMSSLIAENLVRNKMRSRKMRESTETQKTYYDMEEDYRSEILTIDLDNFHESILMRESLLLEDIDAVKRQYSHIPEDDFNKIIRLDPTFSEDRDSVGKYGKWLLGMYKKDNPLESPGVASMLSKYDSYKKDRTKSIEKDINKFKSLLDLEDALSNVGETELSDRQKERELRSAYKEAKLVFSNSNWDVYTPLTYAASCTLGKGTDWCTATSSTDDWYNRYTSKGPLYIFIDKKNPKRKYQLHVETNSFMDTSDRSVDLHEFLDQDEELSKFIYTQIYSYKFDDSGNFIYTGGEAPKDVTKVIVEEGVTEVSREAFESCTSLTSITIPNSVTKIGDDAFAYCRSLTSITIPNSVKEIGRGAFADCESLTSVTIPNSVVKLRRYAFTYCTSLTSISIPNSVELIGAYAFEKCTSLTSISIPNSVEEIGVGAFYGCESLTSITIPNSVEEIGENALVYCKSLKSIILPQKFHTTSTFRYIGIDDSSLVKESREIRYKRMIREALSMDDDPETTEQKYSSAKTSINSSKLPALFKLVKFAKGSINLDYGGGKFDNVVEYLDQTYGATNLVYDKYNRSSQHNSDVLSQVRKNGGADTVTCSNVLNVIAEEAERLAVLRNCKRYLKSGGTCYITVYEGNGSGEGKPTASGYQLNRKTIDYEEEIKSVFPNATRKGKLWICK